MMLPNFFNQKALYDYIKKVVKELFQKYRPRAVNQRMFNRKDAAKYLGISIYKFDKERKLGHIEPVFPFDGDRRYYLREDLDKVVEDAKKCREKVKLNEKA